MIKAVNLTKKFKSTLAVNNLNLEINGGEVFGCLGHNGAGKTTAMRLILGLLKPSSGQALVWGKPLSKHPELRQKVGVLLENDGMYDNLTATENLEYYARLFMVDNRQNKIKRALEFAGLTERMNERAGTFSKGMRRKLGLVRAILHDPEILLLDEPSAGLDPEVQKMVRELIMNLAKEQNMLILLNSHDLDEVERICDRIAILQRGEIVACDSLESLQHNSKEPSCEITLSGTQQASAAKSVLSTLEYVTRINVNEKRVTVSLNQDRVSELLYKLVSTGIKVEEVKRISRSLEDIYLEIIHREENRQ